MSRPRHNLVALAYVVVSALSLGAWPIQAQPSATPAPFRVGTAVAKRGERAYGTITVPPGVDSGYDIPVAVIHGAKPGPVLALVAGAHGTEYASVIALQRLIARIDPKTLSGTVIVAPLVNIASFDQMTVHVNPIDKKSMNGNYPGDPAGTQTQRALALVAEQIVKQAECDRGPPRRRSRRGPASLQLLGAHRERRAR